MIEPLTEPVARQIGALAAASGLPDVVDLSVVSGAIQRGDAVVTSNRSHIEQAAAGAGVRLFIHDV